MFARAMAILAVVGAGIAWGQDRSVALPEARITAKLTADARSLTEIVTAPLAREFLAATAGLAEPSARVVYRDQRQGRAITARDYAALGPEERDSFTARPCPPEFYYETAYGSPLVYSRVVDLAAPHMPRGDRRRSLDFGYGTIGHLQLLARCGFDAHGVDVEPLFPALYGEPGDTGPHGTGTVTLHAGRWPAEEQLRTAIGGGYTLVSSKNTLKNGYLHPTPPPGRTVDPRRRLQLGVGDEEFLRRVHEALRPGGLLVIYNISPPQNPPDEEYLPHADGTCPFPRALLEATGFEVIAFDADDQAWVLDCFERLGYAEGKPREALADAYRCWYTIARKPD